MARQRCVVQAVARQADLSRLLPLVPDLLDVVRNTVVTNIPVDILPEIVPPRDIARHAWCSVAPLQFVALHQHARSVGTYGQHRICHERSQPLLGLLDGRTFSFEAREAPGFSAPALTRVGTSQDS